MSADLSARFAQGYGESAAAYESILDPTLVAVAERIVELAQLKDGRRFVESSWGSDGSNPAFEAVLRELTRSYGDNLHAFGDILDEATWADPATGAAILANHGFAVDVVTEPVHGRYAAPASALAWTLAWPDYGKTAAQLSPAARTASEAAALRSLAQEPLDWWFATNYFCCTATRARVGRAPLNVELASRAPK